MVFTKYILSNLTLFFFLIIIKFFFQFQCLESPHKPQYGGGIIVNPEFNEGLKGWSSFGEAKIQHIESQGNNFIAAHTRSHHHASISQKLYLDKNKLYTFSAWIQVSHGSVPVTAVFKTSSGSKHAGSTIAEPSCWSMLKGGLTVDESGPAELYFQSNDTSVEIWVDNVSLQPFTEEQWKAHQVQSIKKAHKKELRIQVVDAQGNPLPNSTISLQQKLPGFPFGCAINSNILTNTAYRNWYTARPFTVTTFENEMKWYSTEVSHGKVDYSLCDSLFNFAKQQNLSVRGHNVFWDKQKYQPSWVTSLPRTQLLAASYSRLNSVMSRYKGQVIAWDVVNENLHGSFFEQALLRGASTLFYNWALKADGNTLLFMNDYNTIEERGDVASSPAHYLRKLKQIREYPGNRGKIKMAIGLEGHFATPNLPYVRAAIDTVAAAGVPVWITELDVSSSPQQASYLEQILREVRSHPHVSGIVIWAPWKPEGCYSMCLTDNNFKNLATGHVVDKLMHEWGWQRFESATTDADGFFETSLFHGDYEVKISHPTLKNSYSAQTLKVDSTSTDYSQKTPLFLQVSA
ncbi:hypothetical protein UlMin_031129 [Ulmus minor]